MTVNKTENIRIRLTAEEKEFVLSDMEKNGETVLSKYLRKKILNNRIEAALQKNLELERLTYEIRKIGVNINQIAKRYNSGTPFYTDSRQLLENLQRIELLLKTYIEAGT